jgi:para-nitrobenzyl esterase
MDGDARRAPLVGDSWQEIVMVIAQTLQGKVRGAEIADGILGWRGIPYAAPPVGPLRFRPPQPAKSWPGVLDATAYRSPAPQPQANPALFGALALGPKLPPPSEDCLFLNVTVPAGADKRPVLVWMHGGGYQAGSGTDMAGDGAVFARDHGLVVVTFNYRLGALGFLAVPGEAPTGAFGLHDQVAALRWVRENIAAFGGDPEQVTVYGLSAGAKSVACLLASPRAKGLFARAASSSGGEYAATPAQAEAVARRFFRVLGAGPERVRDASTDEIIAAQAVAGDGVRATWAWRPMIDGTILIERPADAVAKGAAAGIPLLAQHCVAECAIYQFTAPDAAEQADRVLEGYFGAAGREEMLAAYAAARPDLAADPARLRLEIMSDERYAIPATRLADAQSAYAPVWRSRYDGPLTGLPPALVPGGTAPAFHGTDGFGIWRGRTGLGRLMHDAWGAFAVTGVPAASDSGAGDSRGSDSAAGAASSALPAWPRYTTAERATMIFHADGPRVVADPCGRQRAAWDGRDWQPGTWWGLGEELSRLSGTPTGRERASAHPGQCRRIRPASTRSGLPRSAAARRRLRLVIGAVL